MKKQKPIEQIKSTSFRKYYYLLGLFTFFIFANSIGNGYNMDDGIVTNGHPLTSQGLSALSEIFTSNYYSDNMGYAFGYRPMVHLSFAIEHELFGEKPGAGHFINVILFALSVVMFFKLLLKWLGEKNILFAGITAVLFAAHPIHTEVVDSLKNRDELLAFLFVVWSGLAAFKYLEKEKWISLVSIVVLFSFAMLSKKSVYPMAVVYPMVVILLKNLSPKSLVLISLSFIIPAAVVGSELNPTRMTIMILIPAIAFVFLFFIKTYLFSKEASKEQLTKFKYSTIIIILIAALGAIAVFLNSFVVLLFTIPLLIWLFKLNSQFGLITLLLLSIGVDILWINASEISVLVLVLGVGIVLYRFLRKEKNNILWISLGVLILIYYALNNYKLNGLAIFISFTLFIYLLHKRKSLIAIGISIIGISVTFVLREINVYPVLLLIISISSFIYEKSNNKNWIRYTAIITFSFTLGLVGYKKIGQNNNQATQIAQQDESIFVKNQNILKEGRQLEFEENTLIAPHTSEEEVGTGLATLGEYFKLMVFPYELSFYYGYAKTDTFNLKSIWVWLIVLIHIGMIFLAIFHVKKNPIISIGVFWYLSCILLFSNWVELVAGMVGERLAFTASAGFCIFLVGILFWIKPDFNLKKPGILGFITILVLVLFAGRTVIRNTDWKDAITLMGEDINHLKNSSQANNIYALHLMAESANNKSLTAVQARDMQQKAIVHFDKAVEVSPNYFNVYIDKARALMIMKDYHSAIESLEKAMEIQPKNKYSYYMIVDAYDKLGDVEQYLKYGKILFEFIQNEKTYGVLARGYYLNENMEKSKQILLEALQKYPNSKALKYNLSLVEQNL